ncbi:MAG TPA: polysaccharide biosynthesis/export family protein [Niabella sp.]|nr:polysaccharide biosynthesis/export family protein [Niabella sp.]HQW14597.1 polysaccharide biosynthesis/export family protein [Niabella sp.]HQX19738.1 polysaccharide biosynthesis/export family protein [Niabella sp.]HQX41687.1 polysaccharide biosynthesis/export family protein [Niabella sp.]HRB35785.1 polysaccharide biosynthesis/export family protein [Niabella sp.]
MMKSQYFTISLVLIASLLISLCSCTSYKKISYFKDVDTSATVYSKAQIIPATEFTSLKIQTDDILRVAVTTLDQDVNGAANITAANNLVSGPATSSALPGTGAKVSDGYLVNKEGNIILPLLGEVKVGGLTIDEAREKIVEKASVIYKSPIVNVRLANFKVTVLGEVAKPGTYNVDGERISVLDALGLSGDLTIYGKRENVMLIRQDGEQNKQVVRMNLNETKMMSSPFFYMKQGDVLYVEPGKGKAASTDMANTRNYAIAGSILSVLIVLLTRINF